MAAGQSWECGNCISTLLNGRYILQGDIEGLESYKLHWSLIFFLTFQEPHYYSLLIFSREIFRPVPYYTIFKVFLTMQFSKLGLAITIYKYIKRK